MVRTTSKLALGSANFGLNYGIKNNTGKISHEELENILSEAELSGIKLIDTAQAYGDSESRIGSLCSEGRFELVTKIGVDIEKDYPNNNVDRLVKTSCKRLNLSRLYAVMLHRPQVLLGDYGSMIISELQILKEQNVISKVGVSIYSPEILKEISKLLQLDIVQVPFNIFDQQIMSSGWSDRLKDNGIEIHTRSAFLQGLLLMNQSSLPKFFYRNWTDHFNSWYDFLKSSGNDPLTAALTFVLKQEWIDKVVVGVDNASQLKNLTKIENRMDQIQYPQLECNDTNLINPSKWK